MQIPPPAPTLARLPHPLAACQPAHCVAGGQTGGPLGKAASGYRGSRAGKYPNTQISKNQITKYQKDKIALLVV